MLNHLTIIGTVRTDACSAGLFLVRTCGFPAFSRKYSLNLAVVEVLVSGVSESEIIYHFYLALPLPASGTAVSLLPCCVPHCGFVVGILRILHGLLFRFADSRFVMSIVWMRQKSRVHPSLPKWRLCSMCRGFLNDVGIATDVHALLLKLPPEAMLIALCKLCCTWKITAPPA